MSGKTYLVIGATGKQGRATLNALIANGVTSIVATSRNPESNSAKKLLDITEVSKVLAADLNDPESIVNAINESGASRLWFMTDWYSIKRPTRAKEAALGKNVIDAILKADNKLEHVVFTSVGDADNCPETVLHFWGKADVESYMAEKLAPTSTTWAVIRPAAFFENLDDAATFNPLKKGKVSMVTKPECSLKYIAAEDIGKGSAVLLMKPEEYAGKKIEAAAAQHTGPELAQALSEVSGVDCKYSMGVPRFVLWLFMRDLYHMTEWFESDGYSGDIDEFKKIVPDAMDAKAWFKAKGQWANGEKFVTK